MVQWKEIPNYIAAIEELPRTDYDDLDGPRQFNSFWDFRCATEKWYGVKLPFGILCILWEELGGTYTKKGE